MSNLDIVGSFQVGDGAGDFEDAGVGAGAHAESVDAALEEGVAFTEHLLNVHTQPIWIEYAGREYELGEYMIKVSFRDGDLRIDTVYPNDLDYPHPHVSSDEVPCLGNLASGVAKLLADGDYAGLIQVMVQFLETYNPGNPYIKIECWDPDYDQDQEQREVWDGCFQSVSSMDCVDCSDHDCSHKDEAEYRCHEGASQRDCIGCHLECRYHEREIEECHAEHACWECVECDLSACPNSGSEAACYESHGGEECDDCDRECGYKEEEP